MTLARREPSVHEIDRRLNGNDAALVALFEQGANGMPPVSTVVQGALVDVHIDEAAGKGGIEIASKLQGVFQSLIAVIHGVADAVAQGAREDGVSFGPE